MSIHCIVSIVYTFIHFGGRMYYSIFILICQHFFIKFLIIKVFLLFTRFQEVFMFYDRLISLCNDKGVKPSPLLRSLGYSATNLKKWQEGGTVNSDILERLAEHFEVPVQYFFVNESENEVDETSGLENNTSRVSLFKALKSHPDITLSLMTATSVSLRELTAVCEYMGCDVSYLAGSVNVENKAQGEDSALSPKDYILTVLNKLPFNEGYHSFQVRISEKILENILNANITRDDLIKIGLRRKKINGLCNDKIDEREKISLNFSDLANISEKLKISFDFMLTGKEA